METPSGPRPALEVRQLSKTFGGFRALSELSFEVRTGEVLGLIGENGAGKSTLLNILCGAIQPDDGELELPDGPYAPQSYEEAMSRGVLRVYQEPANIPSLSVRDNMILGLERQFSRFGLISRRRVSEAVTRALEPVADLVSPDQSMARCQAHVQQAVEILRAFFAGRVLGIERPLILLDEPTAALVSDDLGLLFELMHRLKGEATFVFVSHRLDEITRECDRALVLKDGVLVAEMSAETPSDELHRLMVGRSRADDYYLQSERIDAGEQRVLSVERLSGPQFSDVSLELREGEILGIAGVVGSGKESLGRVLAGAEKRSAGRVVALGAEQSADAPAARSSAGIGYVPSDRQNEGALGQFTVAQNISLSSLGKRPIAAGPFFRAGREREAAGRWVADLGVRPPDPGARMASLSGGNQQKVIMARVLQNGARVLVLDNPTHGVDAGAKEEIYRLLRSVVSDGAALVLISDDLPELIGLSSRIVVMSDGSVKKTLTLGDGQVPSEEELVREMV